ncbi:MULTISPECIES: ABC transporter ATP-binding protein [unclassified Clostridioides]|uniref:ABC transporter ATP-binding protein n=1 Tax=unclassified Clostridioides TaxID=2635829 RepID=UPI001D0C5709|nr:ABC transporter ATP-binding protein [Clostridioides sp. ES-S-0001-02]MCC0639507.1 ABC transporter ATP-binding protein [Clostridioides sp. ES-S-0049-03]MCC0655768.1 ABC transporter ATP-binding protein [Clostridioides sp. ES-S-0123-01]MCC0673973.1 ABC transporter ATP-binding protein [Clostridioides sp. ES-S-0145-01]MCC0680556.1 ABC transporter ATP-binding protein [Clostridioides sp. ES-S-0005-03]MCC0694849.1 ABC transporter ATP-binding protein [Clostridioides sp. ES-S-0048-02]MCC0703036.1 AB
MKKSKGFKKTIGRLLPFVKQYKFSFIIAIICIILAATMNAIAPKTEGLIITQLTKDVIRIAKGIPGASVNFNYVVKILALLACIYVANAIFTYASSFLLTNAIQNTMRDLRNEVENKIRKLPISYFDSNSFGDVLSRISNDVDTISNALQQSFMQIINSILVIILAISMMFTINVYMAFIALFIIPISYFVSKFIVKKSQKRFSLQQNALGKLNGKVQEMYTGFNEIKLYGKEEDSIEEFKKVNQELCENGFKAQFISSMMNPMVSLVTYFGIAAVAVVGSIYAVSGGITVGNLQAFVRYIWQINQPLSQMTQLSTVIQSSFAAIERVFEILDEEEETPDVENPVKIENVQGNVTFEHVNFGYGESETLIEDLNVEIKSGQMVAIVGPTGAGKTTLINLLMRFYDVKGGAIKVDGVDIRNMRREDLRSMFGMVLQDTWLFNGTIFENIEYGRFGATKEEIIQAAKVANVHHFITTLPDGYNMFLNEEASNISLGEKQLLTIARAFISDPSILILDEATSSVDTRLELMLQKAMRNLMNGRTSFVIAHRLSTIRNADLILVMNNGSIIEQGNHDELMEKGGFYEKLYNSQFADTESE